MITFVIGWIIGFGFGRLLSALHKILKDFKEESEEK